VDILSDSHAAKGTGYMLIRHFQIRTKLVCPAGILLTLGAGILPIIKYREINLNSPGNPLFWVFGVERVLILNILQDVRIPKSLVLCGGHSTRLFGLL
jgi:hypothetical protein